MRRLQRRKHELRMICQVPQQHAAFRTFSQQNQTLDMIIGSYHKEC
jgi:hypothetical protein